MIPKIIHYCWFGGKPLTKVAQDCIRSWEKYMPDCRIIEWNEKNFNINSNSYAKDAYKAKKWAFVADYVRIWALVNYGGIYMDVDMKIIKNFDFVFQYPAICGLANPGIISMGLVGCKPGHTIFVDFLNLYNEIRFIKKNGSENLTTNVTMFSELCKQHGLSFKDEFQQINDIYIFPTEYFYPTNYIGTRKNFTVNTYAVHLHQASWLTPRQKFVLQVNKFLAKFKIDIFLSRLKQKMLQVLKGRKIK